MKTIDYIALALVIIGAINWGCIGFFGLDDVGVLFGGQGSFVSRAKYAQDGLAGLWALTFYAKLRSGTSNS